MYCDVVCHLRGLSIYCDVVCHLRGSSIYCHVVCHLRGSCRMRKHDTVFKCSVFMQLYTHKQQYLTQQVVIVVISSANLTFKYSQV